MSNKKKIRQQPTHENFPASNATVRKGTPWWSWLAIAVPVLGLIALVMIGGQSPAANEGVIGAQAPGFTLPATDGVSYSLDEVLASGNEALLYFSMGPGCDGCFAQITEASEVLASQGITLVSIMVDPPQVVAREAARFSITDPILIDADLSVSNMYNMVGVYGHANRPSHSFALVGQDRQIKWVNHYAEMFVPIDQLLADMGLES